MKQFLQDKLLILQKRLLKIKLLCSINSVQGLIKCIPKKFVNFYINLVQDIVVFDWNQHQTVLMKIYEINEKNISLYQIN